MKTLTLILTDAEMAELKRAVEVHHDMACDMMLDDTGLYNIGDTELHLSPKEIKELRDEITKVVDKIATIRSLLIKVGGDVNEAGYSV